MYGRKAFIWDGTQLGLLSNCSLVLATIEPELTWPRMWRVRVPDGYPAAIVDLSRAKDVAASVVPSILNKQGEATA